MPINKRQPRARRSKFIHGDQVKVNKKAPGDYQGLEGVVAEPGPGKSEYGVKFDGQQETAYLNSWWLDPA